MKGVAIMKMTKRTKTTSVKGVVLISAINWGVFVLLLILRPADHVDQFGGAQFHFDDERFHPLGKIIEGDNRGDGDEKPRCRADQGLGNASDHDAHPAGPCRGDIMKRPDDPEHRPKEPDIDRPVPDGPHDAGKALQFCGLDGDLPLHRMRYLLVTLTKALEPGTDHGGERGK